MDLTILTGLAIIAGATILVALLVGRRGGRRRQVAQVAARRAHEERRQEVHTWLIKDRGERAQRVVREGWGSDPAATQVLRWLKARQGMRLHMIYTSSTDAGADVR